MLKVRWGPVGIQQKGCGKQTAKVRTYCIPLFVPLQALYMKSGCSTSSMRPGKRDSFPNLTELDSVTYAGTLGGGVSPSGISRARLNRPTSAE